ncbi:kinase-like domain-containing protein [Gorgonomyces haynaldii]|nr:kinase-like domain-containing protein [Gorgonomyces haynaldii]
MESYSVLEKLGEGAHGVVLKAKHLESGKLVALKRIPLRNLENGIPNNIIREIKALEQLKHKNVIDLKEFFPSGSGCILVFTYCLSDLSQVLRNADKALTEAQIKAYMLMLLKGVDYCHQNSIVHRDLKLANLLISADGILKLADFGLARVLDKSEKRPYSHQVATRWYRAPELLYGARYYDFGVDLWAVGCIFGELLNHSPLFPGQNDIDQLYCVTSVLGTPSLEEWPELETFPDYNKIQFPPMKAKSIREVCPDASQQATDLLKRFLIYPSSKRISAQQALLDDYFFSTPLPAHHLELPIPTKRQTEQYDVTKPIDLTFLK